MNLTKNFIEPFGVLFLFSFVLRLPFTIPRFSVNFLTTKGTMIFTNLFAFKNDLTFDGKRNLGSFFFTAAPGKISCSCSVLTSGS